MKPPSGVFLLCISLAFAVQAQAQSPLDACGDNKVNFNVNPDKKKPKPSPPAAGKAQIVLIETLNGCSGCDAALVRFGMDGAWVGANKGNSYFALDIEPGNHFLCAALQSAVNPPAPRLGPVRLTAEAGNIYYFEVRASPGIQNAKNEGNRELPVIAGGRQSTPAVSGTPPADAQSGLGAVNPDFNFGQLDDDSGKARIKASAHSTFAPSN